MVTMPVLLKLMRVVVLLGLSLLWLLNRHKRKRQRNDLATSPFWRYYQRN